MSTQMMAFELFMTLGMGLLIGSFYRWEENQELKKEVTDLKGKLCKRPHIGDINHIEDELIAKYGNLVPTEADKAFVENKKILGI